MDVEEEIETLDELEQEDSIESELETEESDEIEETEAEESEGDEEVEEEDEGEFVVEIEGESPTPEDREREEAPKWVKDLRKAHREAQKENKDLKERLKALEKPIEEEPIVLGPKPTLADAGHDADVYAKKLDEWHEKKIKADEQENARKAELKKEQESWNKVVQSYEEKKSSLPVKDFDEAEAAVKESVSISQQGIILNGSENPALVVYALGKNIRLAIELAKIKDPVKFAFAVAKFEGKLKVGNRKVKVLPEKKVGGSASISGGNKMLEKLRKEASETGDFSKVNAYKRKLKAKG